MRAIDPCHWNHLNTANTRLAGTEVRALECRWGGSRSAGCRAFTNDKLEAAVVARFPRSWWEYAFRGTRSGIPPGLAGGGDGYKVCQRPDSFLMKRAIYPV